jgi:hypothetical protein
MKFRMNISVAGQYNLASKAEVDGDDVPVDVLAQWGACGHAEPLDAAAKKAVKARVDADEKRREDCEEIARLAKLKALEKELEGTTEPDDAPDGDDAPEDEGE